MIFLSFLSLFAFLIYLFSGFYILKKDSKNHLNRTFAIIALCLAVWSFGYTFLSIAQDRATALFWYRFASLGWINVMGFVLYFALIFTGKGRYFHKWPARLCLFAPGMILTFQSLFSNLFILDFKWNQNSIIEIHDGLSFWSMAYFACNLLFITLFFYFMIVFLKNAKSLREKKQAKIIIFSSFFSTLLAYVFNVLQNVLPMTLPVIGHVFFLALVGGIAYAIERYKLLSIVSTVDSEQIIDQMMDLLFFLDSSGKIRKANPQAEKVLGYTEMELHGRQLANFLENCDKLESYLGWLRNRFNVIKNLELQIRSKDNEIVYLNTSLSNIYDQAGEVLGIALVGHDIGEKIELQKKNEILEKELLLAKEIIENNLIPSSLPEGYGLKIATHYKPMIQVGGDFYDFIKVREPELLGIFISDVSGHGVSAALIASMVKTLLETSGKNKVMPAQLLSFINEKLINLSGGNFLTAFYGLYNKQARKLTFARASHNFPVLIRDGAVSYLESKGKLLGIMEGLTFEEKTISLKTGDKILFYTDGLTEAFDKKGNIFADKWIEVLMENSKKGIKELVPLIYKKLVSHAGTDEFDDDVCLIGIEVEE